MPTLAPLLSILLLLTPASPTPAPAGAAGVNPVVLTVNDEPVYAADISLVMQGLVRQTGAEAAKAEPERIVDAATQRVVEQKLLAQEARRLGLAPDADRVAAVLAAMVEQAGGRAALDAGLARGGTSYERLAESVREVDLTKVYIDRQVRPRVTVSEEEVVAAYQQHPERLTLPERVHLRQILITVPADGAPAAVEAARASAAAARARVAAGEDFATVAREVSEGPSAPRGGDLGVLSADRMPEPLAAAAFSLQVGAISDPVRTPQGFHVIQVSERIPAATATLDEVRPQLRKGIAAGKAAQIVAETIKRLAEAAVIVPVVGGAAAPSPASAPAGPTQP